MANKSFPKGTVATEHQQLSTGAYAERVVVTDGQLKTLGFETVTGLSIAKGLNVPAGASLARISIENNGVRYRSDSTAPTSAVGIPLNAGDIMDFNADLANLKFIETSVGASLNIEYYG